MYCGSLAAQEEQAPDVQPQYTAEIAAIRSNRSVQAAMEYIVAIEPQSRRDLIELTEIPAPPFGEEKRARRFAEMLREAGLSDVTIDEVGNVVGRRPGKIGERAGTRPAAQGDVRSPIVQRAVAAKQAFGMEPQLQISSTDANLPIAKGIPAVTMSRGGVHGNSHAPEEWWQIKDGHIGIQIGLITLLAEAGIAD